MKDLSEKRALAEATRRWGKTAAIKKRPNPEVHPPYFQRCNVGRIVFGFFEIVGSGPTFREAFQDADKKE